MRLSNLNRFVFLLSLILLFFSPISSEEEEVDIWNKKKVDQDQQNANQDGTLFKPNQNTKAAILQAEEKITIEENVSEETQNEKVYGILDPDVNNFSLMLWSNTEIKEIKKAIKRINSLNLSKIADEIYTDTLLTISHTPKNISEDEFLNLKVNWMIEKNKDDKLFLFIEKNRNFFNSDKAIRYLVDRNISKADLKSGCEKVFLLSKDIKNSYLEKFKIYCLVFNNKKDQAQLLYDILKEEKRSDNFFDDKIQLLLGLKDNTGEKVRDDNLLNFYLSSITIPNFNYTPKKNTKEEIWEYMNSANLIKIENFEDKEKIRDLEMAADEGRVDTEKILEIYKKISFDLNSLINAEDVYNSLDPIDGRALMYQKYLLSDNIENKINLLFSMENLYKKDNLKNLYSKFLSDSLKKIDNEKIPENYKELVGKNIISDIEFKLGKIKYTDKIFHKSKVLRIYTEKGTSIKKSQKDLESVFKKIKRNRNYFYSAKDIALAESLAKDGLKIPKEFDYTDLAKQYDVPSNLLQLAKKKEIGFLVLKIVEIIGEDEVSDLDPETIYFITHLLNETELYNIRNKILTTSLPQRAQS